VIDYETFLKIKTYHEQHDLKPSQIADELQLDPRTVEKWIAKKSLTPRATKRRVSKLDPFKHDIVRMLEQHPYSAMQIFQRICQNGFDGGYSIVKGYVRVVRPPKTKPFLKLTFAPGECAQVDWGSYGTVTVGSTQRRLSFFAMVLCYSRMMFVQFTVLQTMEHFLAGHQNAFEYFGAVPGKIMVDNLKSAVLHRFIGKDPVLNPKYLDFANHYGFKIVPCGKGKGNEKGRVENGVGYVKKNFLNGLEIVDFSHLSPAAGHWLDNIANVRTHGETGQRPVDMFEKERNSLKPLPIKPYDIATILAIRASKQFRITVDTNHYSVPYAYAGARLTLKSYPDRLCIYDQNELIARHVRSYDRRQDVELSDHVKPLLVQRKKARDQHIFMCFLRLSPKAEAYYQQLEQRRLNPLHHIRQIVALSEMYGNEKVARAIEDAFYFKAFSCEYITNLLEQQKRLRPEPGALHLTRRQDLLDLTIETPDMDLYNTSLTDDQEVPDDHCNTH
jgi:transposase